MALETAAVLATALDHEAGVDRVWWNGGLNGPRALRRPGLRCAWWDGGLGSGHRDMEASPPRSRVRSSDGDSLGPRPFEVGFWFRLRPSVANLFAQDLQYFDLCIGG